VAHASRRAASTGVLDVAGDENEWGRFSICLLQSRDHRERSLPARPNDVFERVDVWRHAFSKRNRIRSDVRTSTRMPMRGISIGLFRFAIVDLAIQVAPRPRKGMIPPELVFAYRALTSLLPVLADTGP
jgi:hypothetical protein